MARRSGGAQRLPNAAAWSHANSAMPRASIPVRSFTAEVTWDSQPRDRKPTGILMKKIQRQVELSVIHPPRVGPSAGASFARPNPCKGKQHHADQGPVPQTLQGIGGNRIQERPGVLNT